MDKQIEELEKDIAVRMEMAKGIVGSMNNGVEGWLSEYLIEKGWKQIPEGAVVLTAGEYSDLLLDEIATIERDIAEYWATQDFKSVAKELHKDGYRKLDDHAIFVLRKAKSLEEKGRKETAEKFAKMLKDKFNAYEYIVADIDSMHDFIDEICEYFIKGDKV